MTKAEEVKRILKGIEQAGFELMDDGTIKSRNEIERERLAALGIVFHLWERVQNQEDECRS